MTFIESLVKRATEFTLLEENWDDNDGIATTQASVDLFAKLLQAYEGVIDKGYVSPTGDGGISFEIKAGNKIAECGFVIEDGEIHISAWYKPDDSKSWRKIIEEGQPIFYQELYDWIKQNLNPTTMTPKQEAERL